MNYAKISTFESSLAREVKSSCIWSTLRQEKLRLRLFRQARPLWTGIILESLVKKYIAINRARLLKAGKAPSDKNYLGKSNQVKKYILIKTEQGH